MDARRLLVEASEQLAAANVDSPRVDAELLLAARLGIARSQLLTRDEVPDSIARSYREDLDRRARREPLQHITGVAPFRHLELRVGPGVFVPRPETELLVDAVLPHLRSTTGPRVIDLCSGSGALALALADELDDARVIAVERAAAALRYLSDNVAVTDVGGSEVRVLGGDITDPELLMALYGRADAVVSNPPYVPSAVEVAPEVRADPQEAVFAGSDGLDLMSTVAHRAVMLLKPGGVFAVEHDDTHGESVPALLREDGRWTGIEARRDLAGRPRYTVATRALSS